MTKKILISGIEIEVEKKKIKNMYLKVSVHDGKVRISAPLRTKDEAIIRFAASKITWIKKQEDKFKERAINIELNYVDGEKHYVWGEPYVLLLEYGSKNCVEIRDNNLIMTVSSESTRVLREKILLEWYRSQLKRKLPKLFEKWESIIGVKAEAITVRNMKSRWGSCNTRDRRISINLQLAQKPICCLEYVIVHELVHLLEHSHNAVFKGYLDQFLPNWRNIKKELI